MLMVHGLEPHRLITENYIDTTEIYPSVMQIILQDTLDYQITVNRVITGCPGLSTRMQNHLPDQDSQPV